jgi:hypothetical protein
MLPGPFMIVRAFETWSAQPGIIELALHTPEEQIEMSMYASSQAQEE